MTSSGDRIPFSIEVSRMIEVLAAQIYPSPFALLRENTQNSFDAILLRRHLGQVFDPLIEVEISGSEIKVSDNGIGMSRDELRNHFWRAGSSSKNNADARAAGVVGTFGIGAMANFGIAEELTVVTESAKTHERTRCAARRSTLSVTEDCIEFESLSSTGEPGTVVVAAIQAGKTVNVEKAKAFIAEFVAFLPIKMFVNGSLVSQRPFSDTVPPLVPAWSYREKRAQLSSLMKADVDLVVAASGEVRIELGAIELRGKELDGILILRQGGGSLRTFRSRFGLATVSVQSAYHLGGVADFLFLQPTAGREALTTASMQTLQDMISQIDEFISHQISSRPESNSSTNFMSWVTQRQLYELCGELAARVEPGGKSVILRDLKLRSQTQPLLIYAGADPSFISHASDDRNLVVLSRSNPRRQCETEYLRRYCKIEELTDEPRVLKAKPQKSLSIAESALAFRVSSILSADYFFEADISFGEVSHGLPVIVTHRLNPYAICLDAQSSSVQLLLGLYDREYAAFGNMAKDFVRNIIFPRISDLVPSSTRQGAEAFLKSIQRSREVFEYDVSDQDSLASIWSDYVEGRLSMEEAAHRSSIIAVQTFQVLDSSATGSVRDVVPDVIENDKALERPEDQPSQNLPMPAVERRELDTDRKLLLVPDGEPALRGYRCFLALTDRIRDERGDFFLQPHRTSIVWGGQKVLLIFEHHSGEFGLYYDIQSSDVMSEQSGGGSFPTCTIVLKNKIFVPIPEQIRTNFMPRESEKKRLEVRCDMLYTQK